MKITESKVTKVQLTEVKSLDPINIILEDFGPGQGKITIECFSEAWTSYWSAMGKDNTMDKFFCSCDNHYLAQKLAPMLKSDIAVEDTSALITHAKNHIIQRRKDDSLNKEEARRLYDGTETLEMNDHNTLYDIYGDEWWDSLPTEPNPDYQYLCRIIDAAREGLKQRGKL